MKWHENLGDGVRFKLNFKTEVELFASEQLVAGEASQNCREVCILLSRWDPRPFQAPRLFPWALILQPDRDTHFFWFN